MADPDRRPGIVLALLLAGDQSNAGEGMVSSYHPLA
jgi:hypothetical protein